MNTFFYKTFPKGVIRVREEDAEDYLQSQWTINFKRLSKGEIRYGLRLSTRGRVLADSFFFRLGEEEFLLVSRGCEGTEINSLLEENIVADEVEFSNESNDWELITVWGSKEELSTLFKEVNRPEKGNFVQFENGYLFEDFAISPGTYSLLRPISDAMPDGWMPREATWECLEKQRIRFGLASIPNEIGPDELPQEGRLEVDAIDFNKGCYLGQEVMARIHAMGRVRRLTVPVLWNGQKLPSLPTSLFADGKKCGILKSLIVQDGEKPIGMALIHENGIDSLEGEGLTLEGISEGRIQPL